MEDLLDMIVSDESPSQISDKIKDILFSKSAEKIESLTQNIAPSIFDDVEGDEFNETEE
jgi:hypothetical protein